MRLYPALTTGGKGSPISRLKTVPTPVSDLCPPSHAGTAEATAWTSRAPHFEHGLLTPRGARPAALGCAPSGRWGEQPAAEGPRHCPLGARRAVGRGQSGRRRGRTPGTWLGVGVPRVPPGS